MRATSDPIRDELVRLFAEHASAGASEALARLEERAARVPCPTLLLYWSARREAMGRGEGLLEHAPGVPAVDPEEYPAIAAIVRGEAWLAGGGPGGWQGLLRDLHWELMQGLEATPGELRSAPAWLCAAGQARGRRRFPPPSSVGALLEAFERALREEAAQDPVLAAGAAHARVALIHPFRDGNGRTAHALVPVILRELGLLSRPCLALGAAFRSRKRVYFAALDRLWSGDAAPWMDFFLATLAEVAAETAEVCQAILEQFALDERRVRPGEARRLLERLAEGALPRSEVARAQGSALASLLQAGIASVAPGCFGEPIVFHADFAKILAGGCQGRDLAI